MDVIQTKTRIKTFDILKLFAIFLVLWGHCIQYFTSGNPIDKPVYVYIYSFHMPLFMMISGYFTSSSMALPIKEFLKKKIIQLLLPCVIWGSILTFLVFILQQLKGNYFCLWEMYKETIVGNFWFLKSLFVCYVIVFIGRKVLKNTFAFIAITLIFIHLCSCFSAYNLPVMYPCFLAGIYLRNVDNIWKQKSLLLFVFSSVFFIILLCFWNKTFWDYQPLNIFAILFQHKNCSYIDLYREIYHIVIGIIGGLSFISLFYLLLNRNPISSFLDACSEWGKYTLSIYILQGFILEIFMAKFIKLDNLSFLTFNFIIAPLLSVFILMICVLISKFIGKFSILNFFLFGVQLNK